MSEDVDLFAEDQTVNVETPLAELVGEGKKFKTVEDLAKGKLEADNYIKTLLNELKQTKEELNGRLKLEQFMDRLEKAPNATSTGTSQVTSPNETTTNANPTGLTKEDLDRLLSVREKEAQEKANIRFVAERLKETFGENYQSYVNNKAKELDLGTDYLTAIAKERPNAFLKLMGTPQKDTGGGIPKGSVNTASFNTTPGPSKKYSDFEKLRRESPNTYWSGDVQTELYKLVKEYGPDFYKT